MIIPGERIVWSVLMMIMVVLLMVRRVVRMVLLVVPLMMVPPVLSDSISIECPGVLPLVGLLVDLMVRRHGCVRRRWNWGSRVGRVVRVRMMGIAMVVIRRKRIVVRMMVL